jgi:hypothetical protein
LLLCQVLVKHNIRAGLVPPLPYKDGSTFL